MSNSGKMTGRKAGGPKRSTKDRREARGMPVRKTPSGKTKGGAPNVRAGDKIAGVVVMLCRVKGASIAELSKATGWRAHSVRAAISATIKKKLRLQVLSEKVGKVRRYRIVDKAGS